jgi:shikimate kinase / 3-dehydroquinate synthase
MNRDRPPNLVLAGFMGTGKSTVGNLVAERLGWAFVDTDQLIEQEAGLSVKEIFAAEGEPAFRARERRACQAAAGRSRTVISVGGGAVLDPRNVQALGHSGVLVLLTCEVTQLVERLGESARRGERPMLPEGTGEQIGALLKAREPAYSSIGLSVDTTNVTPCEVADRVMDLYNQAVGELTPSVLTPSVLTPSVLTPSVLTPSGRFIAPGATPPPERSLQTSATRVPVRSPEGSYDIVLGHGLLGGLGALAEEGGLGRRVVVATDTNVAGLYACDLVAGLQGAGFQASVVAMPAGEQHKSWESVSLLVDGFAGAGLDRGGWVAALGGGVVGDTAGFAASIYMRGVALVQLPTTLLAMADSSIGGKVGVDHAGGKNLLGAFKQPRLVVADLDALASLPEDQVACGMAEIIKAGIIGDPDLFQMIEASEPGSIDYGEALLKAISVKREIVQRDPHEAGERALLNLGHTFGHAFEKCTGYARLHGFAVSQGMVVAFRLAETVGMCDTGAATRVERVLAKWGLPVRWGAPDLAHGGAIDEVWQAMTLDKKRQDGRLRLVLPEAIGSVRLVDNMPEAAVKSALAEMQ